MSSFIKIYSFFINVQASWLTPVYCLISETGVTPDLSMIQITKIFHFEMAHAIDGYNGACKDVHGHSYELHVSVGSKKPLDGYIPAPGLIFDFRDLKKIVSSSVLEVLDHKLVLSRSFIAKKSVMGKQENIVLWNAEPTAENLLIYIRETLKELLPENIILTTLKLYETRHSYAEWVNGNI